MNCWLVKNLLPGRLYSHEIVYQQQEPIDFAAMPPANLSPLLARLRRSTRLAVFMAAVMLAKLIGSYACLSEESRGTAAQQVAVLGDGVHASELTPVADHADPLAVHNTGGCCHCSCHQVTTLPSSVAVVQAQLRRPPLPAMAAVAVPTRLERELRPPIV